ncbi:MAG: sensor histidine kinase [Pyrinomonadaceae bacterium]|nr:sensor histidine kinase [Phycisphaerales bacterium]
MKNLQPDGSTVADARFVQACAAWIGIVVACGALAMLIVWIADVQEWTRLWVGLTTMKPMTAFALFFSGAALALLANWPGNTTSRRLASIGAALVFCIGFFTMFASAMGFGGGIHVPDAEVATDDVAPILLLPSIATAISMILTGVGVLVQVADHRLHSRVGDALFVALLLITSISLMDHLLDASGLYAFQLFSNMSLQTALSFFMLAAAMCFIHPTRGFAGSLIASDVGGAMMRRLIPVIVLAPLLAGIILRRLQESDGHVRQGHIAVLIPALVLIGALATILTARRLSKSDDARLQGVRRIRLMMAELDHRVRNNMAATLSMCEQTARSSVCYDDFSKSYAGRLRAMTHAYDALSGTRWQGVSLSLLAHSVVEMYTFSEMRRLEMVGEDLLLPAAVSMPLATTLNELASNAARHGAWSDATPGLVRLTWRLEAAEILTINWVESGGPKTKVAWSQSGFGMSLIKDIIPYELHGQVECKPIPGGMQCSIRLLLSDAEAASAARITAA